MSLVLLYFIFYNFKEQTYLSNCSIKTESLIPIQFSNDGINYQEYGFDLFFSSSCDITKKFQNKHSYRFNVYCYDKIYRNLLNKNNCLKMDSLSLIYGSVWNYSKNADDNYSLVLINKTGDRYLYKIHLINSSTTINIQNIEDSIISIIQNSDSINAKTINCLCRGTIFSLLNSYSSNSEFFSIEAQHLRPLKKNQY